MPQRMGLHNPHPRGARCRARQCNPDGSCSFSGFAMNTEIPPQNVLSTPAAHSKDVFAVKLPLEVQGLPGNSGSGAVDKGLGVSGLPVRGLLRGVGGGEPGTLVAWSSSGDTGMAHWDPSWQLSRSLPNRRGTDVP